MEILSASGVTINYGAVTAVDNASFNVNQGDYFCIAGSNGSGKSTLLKGIIGLASIKSGHLHVNLPKEQISYLSQTNRADRDFPATVWEIILSGTQKSGKKLPFYSKQDKQNAEESMIKLGMEKFKNTRIGNLSGGQQQRVLLARALCASSKLILLDEPVAGLDPKVTADMYEIIKDLNRSGVTVIMVSHDIEAAIKYSTHILHVAHTPKFFGTTEDYLSSDAGIAFLKGGRKNG